MKLQRLLLIASCAAVLSACSESKFPNHTYSAYPTRAGCAGNHYLERYGCSLERLTAAARSGDPDAQYGLGYMYYYGIGTMRDEARARDWIKRAAAQGQPLAVKAYQMMTGVSLAPGTMPPIAHPDGMIVVTPKHPRPSLHQSREDVTQLNEKKSNRSVQEQLPAYKKRKNASTAPIPDSSKLTPNNSNSTSQNSPQKPVQKADQNLSQKPVQKAEGMGQSAAPTKLSSAERWMMRNPGKHYSLQLMGSHDIKSIERFMAKNHLEGKARFYSAELQGQKWYMLVYGDFNSAKQAEHASKKLPHDLKARHPWIKSYAVIQKEIEGREIIS